MVIVGTEDVSAETLLLSVWARIRLLLLELSWLRDKDVVPEHSVSSRARLPKGTLLRIQILDNTDAGLRSPFSGLGLCRVGLGEDAVCHHVDSVV